uniref:Uncharacterized conserved protein, DUF433 family n=1 Tax=Candidatus Kentrum sp. LFY TaxID=2126342 RepID=A0A450WEI3_9GAMM|nr:MAG: Uncharacterized conserved protein, DUF433 family [Candidatus Kentron sp. LFY]
MKTSVISIDPEVMSGTPVFRGTRVPIQHFIEYMEHDDNGIDDFFDGFPGVSREQVIELIERLEEVKGKILATA